MEDLQSLRGGFRQLEKGLNPAGNHHQFPKQIVGGFYFEYLPIVL